MTLDMFDIVSDPLADHVGVRGLATRGVSFLDKVKKIHDLAKSLGFSVLEDSYFVDSKDDLIDFEEIDESTKIDSPYMIACSVYFSEKERT